MEWEMLRVEEMMMDIYHRRNRAAMERLVAFLKGVTNCPQSAHVAMVELTRRVGNYQIIKDPDDETMYKDMCNLMELTVKLIIAWKVSELFTLEGHPWSQEYVLPYNRAKEIAEDGIRTLNSCEESGWEL